MSALGRESPGRLSSEKKEKKRPIKLYKETRKDGRGVYIHIYIGGGGVGRASRKNLLTKLFWCRVRRRRSRGAMDPFQIKDDEKERRGLPTPPLCIFVKKEEASRLDLLKKKKTLVFHGAS